MFPTKTTSKKVFKCVFQTSTSHFIGNKFNKYFFIIKVIVIFHNYFLVKFEKLNLSYKNDHRKSSLKTFYLFHLCIFCTLSHHHFRLFLVDFLKEYLIIYIKFFTKNFH